jgi:exodeoxyribonuclease-1
VAPPLKGEARVRDSFYFYDLETTGRDPRWHRIVQFAGVRTDADFEPVEEPVSFLSCPDDDVVPEPEALLVTGLAPSDWVDGVDERSLFRRIDAEFSRPRSCVAGYNNLRFDDEFVRFGLWRTLRDPYAREWKSGNSRWDLIDLARMAAALRPDGIVWPEIDGRRSFRLEHLAAANGIEQARAHDAVSDVLATVGLARRLRAAQPRLVDFHLGLRDKRVVTDLLLPLLRTPCLHVSGRYPGSAHHLALVVAVAMHPTNRNSVLVADLSVDPEAWGEADAVTLRETLFAPSEALAGRTRPPLKEVHLNKVPALAPLAVLRGEDAERLGLDPALARVRIETLRRMPGLGDRVTACYERAPRPPSEDVFGSLYDGFLPDGDRRTLGELRDAAPDALASPPPLEDARAQELAFEHLARSHPDALDDAGRARFAERVRDRLARGRDGMRSLASVRAETQLLLAEGAGDGEARRVLGGLLAHLDTLAARWGVTVA